MSTTDPTPTGERTLFLNMNRNDVRHIIETQLSYANYLRPAELSAPGKDRIFYDNQSLWTAILAERIRASMYVTLENFAILEWFPRSPGLYFTEEASRSRQNAGQFLDSDLPRSGSETNPGGGSHKVSAWSLGFVQELSCVNPIAIVGGPPSFE